MPITLPYTISTNDEIRAVPLQANFQTLADRFSAGIVDGDISANAGIQGTKIAANTMPGNRIGSGTIAQLQMGANSVGATQLIDAEITKSKLTVTAGQRITKAQTEIKTWLKSDHSFNVGSNILFALECEVAQQVVGSTNSWRVVSRVSSQNAGTGAVAVSYFSAAPAVAVPVATTQVLGLVVRDVTATTGVIGWTTELVYIENS